MLFHTLRRGCRATPSLDGWNREGLAPGALIPATGLTILLPLGVPARSPVDEAASSPAPPCSLSTTARASSSSRRTPTMTPLTLVPFRRSALAAPAPSGDFALAWPMTRSMRLPEEPFDNVGVQPDVPFPEGGVEDEIAWAQAWLERQAG